jgi:hypothetical protein
VVEARADPAQVAVAVAIGIGERARVDLVEDAVLPPRAAGGAMAATRAREAGPPEAGGTVGASAAHRSGGSVAGALEEQRGGGTDGRERRRVVGVEVAVIDA